jgi:hypothetical protein
MLAFVGQSGGDFVLGHAASFLEDMHAADADLAAGRTRPSAEVFAELEG